jgi:hypothetical protein
MADLKGLEMMSMILLDTGCSQHTFADKSSFSELKMFKPYEMTRSIHGIGGTILQPIGIGTVTLHVSIKGQPHTLRLTNALYCPDLQANLISASQLLDKNVKITLRKHGATVKSASKKVVCEIRHESGLFILSTWQDQQTAMASYSSSNDPIKRLWHERLAHIDPQSLERLQNMSTTLNLKHIPHEDCTCEACVSGAMRDITHQGNISKEAKKPYDVVFSDLEGPMSIAGYDGSRYFVSFLDAFSKESEVIFSSTSLKCLRCTIDTKHLRSGLRKAELYVDYTPMGEENIWVTTSDMTLRRKAQSSHIQYQQVNNKTVLPNA